MRFVSSNSYSQRVAQVQKLILSNLWMLFSDGYNMVLMLRIQPYDYNRFTRQRASKSSDLSMNRGTLIIRLIFFKYT